MSGKHVCMVVKNRLSTDARVKKEAAALAGDGWRVTVIAMPEKGSPERETRGDRDNQAPGLFPTEAEAQRKGFRSLRPGRPLTQGQGSSRNKEGSPEKVRGRPAEGHPLGTEAAKGRH